MIVRTRTTRKITSPFGVVVAVAVVSFVVLSLLYNCKDVRSFSTTTAISLASRTEGGRRHAAVTTQTHDQNNDPVDESHQPPQRNKNKTNKNKNNTYKDRREQQQRERERRELQNKLRRACDSILYYGQDSANDQGKLPSVELQTRSLTEISQSYTSAILESSPPISPESKHEAVQKLLDPWELRGQILEESRPVQERVLGLLAVLIMMATHIEEQYKIFYSNNGGGGGKKNRNKTTMPPADAQKAIDRIRFVQNQLWKTSREVLSDMAGERAEAKETNGEDAKVPRNPHVVSPIAVTALTKALRETSTESRFLPDTSSGITSNGSGVEEIRELMQLVDDARKAAKHHGGSNSEEDRATDIDLALEGAWNNYLSSLCDRALATKNSSDTGLGTAAKLVMQSNDVESIVSSDITSYNTVMNIAAKVGNASLVDTLWQDLIKKGEEQQQSQFSIQPNSWTYNARLMVINDAQQRLQILDKEIIPAAFRLQRQSVNASAAIASDSVIDGFTIDFVMMPLLQAKRKKYIFQLIDHWMVIVNRQHNVLARGQDPKEQKASTNKSQRAFRNALAAFFITLVQRNGDVRTAREIWNRYMVLDIDIDTESSDANENNTHTDAFLRITNIVSPERRHYNILLDGYARLVDQVRVRQARNLDRTPDNNDTSGDEKDKRTTKIWEAPASFENNDEKNDRDAISTSKYFEEVQEKAIHDGQELFAIMMAQQQQQNPRKKIGPDAYTKSVMIRLCRSGEEVQNLLQESSDATATNKKERTWLPRAVTRTAVTTCGRLGDPSMACVIFDRYMFADVDSNPQKCFSNYRAFNVLLGALAAGAKLDNPRLDVAPTMSATEGASPNPSFLLSKVHGLTCTEAVVCILNLVTSKNSQSYCVAASALQYAPIHERERLSETNTNATAADAAAASNKPETATPLALQIFYNATRDGIQADGRLVNAIFRCYGDDIAGALSGWKNHIRRATYDFEQKNQAFDRGGASTNMNMLAAYNGLMYVCGRAQRPDIAVRIVYAMKNKEGLDPSENPYNNYRSGKSTRKNLVKRDKEESRWRGLLPKIDMVGQYENILYVECKKYDTRDRRMDKEQRIRIIV